MLRPDWRFGFRRQVCEMQRTHRTQGIIFADEHSHSGFTAATLHHRHTIDPESDTWRFLGLIPAIQRYKIHPQRAIIHEVTGQNGVRCWPSQTSMADSSTTTAPILDLIAGDCWARRQLRNGIWYVPVASKPKKLLSSVERILIVALAILYSMADYSTTAGRILILFAGGCWARRQLSNGIRYVSVTSRLRKSLSSVEGVLGIKLAILYSMADYSTTAGRILILFAGGCWAQRLLSNGIRYVSVASRLRKSLSSVEGVLGIKLAIFYSMADYSTTAGRILILFAGGCWARRRLRNGIRFISPRILFMILQGPG